MYPSAENIYWRILFLAAPVLLLASLSRSLNAQITPKPVTRAPVRPLQAELMQPLDLTHVRIGSVVFARVDVAWSDSSCSLLAGGVVRAHVSAITKRSKIEKTSALHLVFDSADCKGSPEFAPGFALLALVGPVGSTSHDGQSGVSEGPPLSNDLPLTIGGSRGGIRNAEVSSAITDNFNLPARNLPSQILPGQVIDLPRTHIETAADGVSVITADHMDVRLEKGTTLVLADRAVATARLARPAVASSPAGFTVSGTGGGINATAPDPTFRTHNTATALPPPPPPDPPDMTEICSGACATVGPADKVPALSQAAATISLNSFGFTPVNDRELPHFTQDTTVVYLGSDHLLCTFDPRHLRSRTDIDGESSRTIRAVLINTANNTVQRVFDWRVRGNTQYLWQLSSGHLLVHLGHQLQEFDTDLRPLRSIHLDGRVAWVVASPSGSHIAVGTVRERYSFAFRTEMEQVLPEAPEEDIEVRVFDDAFQQLMSVIRSSHAPAPVLSDRGELRVQRESNGHWRISEIDWERQEHALAQTRSACRPTLAVPEHGLLFMTGCAATGGRWYRVLREDGRPVLKGDSPSTEVELSARGSSGKAFAVRTVETAYAFALGQPFRPSDLVQERVNIYNSETGARLFGLVSRDFAPVEQGYAVSPNGSQMVLVGRDALHVYPIAHTAP